MTVKGSLVGLEGYFCLVSFLDPTLWPGPAWLFYSTVSVPLCQIGSGCV